MNEFKDLRTVQVVRYVTPLREGGSLPAIAEADDSFLYVLKFRGAGHGTKALVSEFLGGEIARKLGFKVPEIVFCELDEAFGRSEGDEEIQDLLKGSQGLNIGLHFLSGAINYDPVVYTPSSKLASSVIWLDAFILNIDRTFRNTNMLIWNKEVWMIDHGASFFFHHSWSSWEKAAASPFVYVKDHVMLQHLNEADLRDFDAYAKTVLTYEFIHNLVYALPSSWLKYDDLEMSEEEIRDVYINFLKARLEQSETFIKEALHAKGSI